MRCPHCSNKLLQKSDSGVRLRITGQITLDGEGAHAQCYWCKSAVSVPLRLVEQQPAERYTIRRK